MDYRIRYEYDPDTAEVRKSDGVTIFRALRDCEDARCSVGFVLDAPIDDTYIMIPACAYNGNRFHVSKHSYPPMLDESELGIDVPIRITDVPALSIAGDSYMDVTTGDMAMTCVCVLRKKRKRAFIVAFDQQAHDRNLGVTLEQKGDELEICLCAPAHRRKIYTMGCTKERDAETMARFDPPMKVRGGDEIRIRHDITVFDCADIPALYDAFFELRSKIRYDTGYCREPFSKFFSDYENSINAFHYDPRYRMYTNCTRGAESASRYAQWQAGWVGGGINTLALISDGSEQTIRRSIETLLFAAKYQSNIGFYYGIVHEGRPLGDGFDDERYPRVLLVRKHADLLLFMSRQIILMRERSIPIPRELVVSVKKAADALVALWDRYGVIGQFVDVETGEMLCGASSSAAVSPAALCAARAVTGKQAYLNYARRIALHYYKTATLEGYTTGGPGEILECPDSESAAGMLESFITLYETDGDSSWLEMAKDAAHQLSSWIVSYDYRFPEGSRFGRMGVHAAGSVWANIQNKHSAPGICTHSAASLLKLFRATGDMRYLDIMKQVSHMVPQVTSISDEPLVGCGDYQFEPGEICERVNLSDWEMPEGVGDSIYGDSVWPDVFMALTYSEIPGIYAVPEKGVLAAADHVKAELHEACIEISNPTRYDADVKVLIEKAEDMKVPLGLFWLDRFRTVTVKAGETKKLPLNV